MTARRPPYMAPEYCITKCLYSMNFRTVMRMPPTAAQTTICRVIRSDSGQLRELGDEFLRAGALEVDGQLRIRSASFHRQDRSVSELLMPNPHPTLQLRPRRLGLLRRVDGGRIELHRSVLEERKDGVG